MPHKLPHNKVSLEAIRAAIAEAGEIWEAGVTSMSVLSVEEQKARLGVNPPPGTPPPGTKATTGPKSAASVGAPSSFFWGTPSNNNYVTPVKDQGGCGSCVAFGTTAVVESMVRIQRGDPSLDIDLSEAHLFFCHGPATGASCSNGWWPQHAFGEYQSKGVADEACFPYNAGATSCQACSDWANRATKITGFTDLTGNPAGMKEWISTTGPLSGCFEVYDDFFSYKSGVYRHVSGNLAGGHCVSIVGYDDGGGYWMCKNSWGTSWGDRGYFCIAYGECFIDSWNVYGAAGVENTGWRQNVRVLGLWAINEDRNAWVYMEGFGWRKVSPDNDNILIDMLAQLIAAKARGGVVTYYEEQGVIKQLYAF
jgi:C1A family cysteine protease